MPNKKEIRLLNRLNARKSTQAIRVIKTHSELRLTESAFDDKLNNVLYNGIIDFNRSCWSPRPCWCFLIITSQSRVDRVQRKYNCTHPDYICGLLRTGRKYMPKLPVQRLCY